MSGVNSSLFKLVGNHYIVVSQSGNIKGAPPSFSDQQATRMVGVEGVKELLFSQALYINFRPQHIMRTEQPQFSLFVAHFRREIYVKNY